MEASISVMILDKAICAFHRDLCDPAILVEDVEEIPLRNLFGIQVAYF